MTNFRLRTPHAAVKIWNYVDRMHAKGATQRGDEANTIKEEIISTISCVMIQTVKTKANPIGSFHFVLAPTRNWTAVITPGSWCVIMMSNLPFLKENLIAASPAFVKMVGKIESVRTSVTVNSDGSRKTQFLVSGQDWGHVFSDALYVDPIISDANATNWDQGENAFKQLLPIVHREGTPLSKSVKENLQMLLGTIGRKIEAESKVPVLMKNTHSLKMPKEMKEFFGFENNEVLNNVKLVTGALKDLPGQYEEVPDGECYLNPFELIGTHSIWQVMQEHSNYAMNEMFNELSWDAEQKPALTLYNRIKPFAFRRESLSEKAVEIRSLYKYVPCHMIDPVTVVSVNAGTNWRDKYNFIEVKPDISEFTFWNNLIKMKGQTWDAEGPEVFDREGFRPLILAIKQIPMREKGATSDSAAPQTPEEASNDPNVQNVIGYYKGNPFHMKTKKITGASGKECWVNEKAASDTQAWFDAAKDAGLAWGINSSFRTEDEQLALLGNPNYATFAAAAGWSPHQRGCGLDVHAISKDNIAVQTDAEKEDILANLDSLGQQHGWKRDVWKKNGAKNDEPWHFTYQRWSESDIDKKNPPASKSSPGEGATREPDPDAFEGWVSLLKEWYFDTHRLLNGEIILTGTTEYLPVGDNIMFDVGLLGIKPNLNKGLADEFIYSAFEPGAQFYILAHIEGVKNVFQVDESGARTFQTTVTFVRGIVVDSNKNPVGEGDGAGTLDILSTDLTKEESRNDINMISSETSDNPGPKKE